MDGPRTIATGVPRLLNIFPSTTYLLSRGPRGKGCACWAAIARQIARSGYFPFAFSAASRASRSALSRSRLLENAFCAVSCSVIAFSASTWRNALRASRSAEVIGLVGATSPGVVVFVISSPSARPANVAGPRLSVTGAFYVESQPFAFPDVVRIDARRLQRADVEKHIRTAGVAW